jgi:uncharacterized membrane protein YcaP (DUF421 family)
METVFRAIIAYWVLLLVLRLTGRRSGKRMTPFEILLIFLLGGQMTQAILGDDRSLTNALIGVSTVGLMHAFVATVKLKWTALAKVIDGTPVVIYADDTFLDDRMNMVRVSREDVMASAREDGVEHMKKIRYAIVERNGAISIITKDS